MNYSQTSYRIGNRMLRSTIKKRWLLRGYSWKIEELYYYVRCRRCHKIHEDKEAKSVEFIEAKLLYKGKTSSFEVAENVIKNIFKIKLGSEILV